MRVVSIWVFRNEPLADERGLRITVQLGAKAASFTEIIRGWQGDPAFRAQFNGWLADSPYQAFRWETPAVTTTTLNRPFECVLLDSPGLAPRPDRSAFAEHFAAAGADGVVEFQNLGGDATLIVPTPLIDSSAYGHLALFVRQAPEQQRDAFWRFVGNAMERRVGRKPVWLSTAGAGVSWLHVRLDDRPKYYHFTPYRQTAGPSLR